MSRFILPAATLLIVPQAVFAQDGNAEALGAGIGLVIGLLLALIVGAVVGWLASLIVKGTGSGLLVDILIGIGGSIIASYALSAMGVTYGVVGALLASIAGAVVLLLIVKMIRRA